MKRHFSNLLFSLTFFSCLSGEASEPICQPDINASFDQSAQVCENNLAAMPVVNAARSLTARAPVQDLQDKLIEALQLRHSIRSLLFETGQRVTKELIAEARGNFSGGSLFLLGFGGGSINGDFDQKIYENLAKDGELFVITVAGEYAQEIASQLDYHLANNPGLFLDRCSNMIRTLIQERVTAGEKLALLEQAAGRFQQLLNEIELAVALDSKVPARYREVFTDLKTWGQKNVVKILAMSLSDDCKAGVLKNIGPNEVGLTFSGLRIEYLYDNKIGRVECHDVVSKMIKEKKFLLSERDLRIY